VIGTIGRESLDHLILFSEVSPSDAIFVLRVLPRGENAFVAVHARFRILAGAFSDASTATPARKACIFNVPLPGIARMKWLATPAHLEPSQREFGAARTGPNF